MIPQRTLAGTCEITTGALAITQRPPIYTGESAALKVEISFTFQNVAYPIPPGVVAEMYLKFPNTEKMTVAVSMDISGNKATGFLTGEQTGLEGYPLLIVQLTDTETASLIVACATTVKVSDVRGNLVVDTRAPTPSEIVYVGRSPYIDPTTKHWITWDSEQAKYVDTGINAEGVIGFTPSISIGTVQSVPTGESAEVTRTGTDRNPVLNFKLPRSGDGVGIYPVDMTIAVAEWVEESGVYKYTLLDATIKAYMTVLESWLDDEAVQFGKVWYTVNDGSLVVNTDVVPTAAWALHVTLGTDGTDVLEDVADLESRFPVSIADGGTGGTTAETARQALGITGANVPTSAVSGQTNVDGALGGLSHQIVNLQNGLALPVITGTINNSGSTIENGNFFIIDSFICIATADISNGATLTIGTNFKKIDMGALNKVLSTINERIRIANIPTDGDLNDYAPNGITLYVCNWADTRQNRPTGFNAGIVLVVSYGSFTLQFASPHTSNSVLWFRSKYTTTWHEWKQIGDIGVGLVVPSGVAENGVTINNGGYIKIGNVVIFDMTIILESDIAANIPIINGMPTSRTTSSIVGFMESGNRATAVLTRRIYTQIYSNGAMPAGTYRFTGTYLIV